MAASTIHFCSVWSKPGRYGHDGNHMTTDLRGVSYVLAYTFEIDDAGVKHRVCHEWRRVVENSPEWKKGSAF